LFHFHISHRRPRFEAARLAVQCTMIRRFVRRTCPISPLTFSVRPLSTHSYLRSRPASFRYQPGLGLIQASRQKVSIPILASAFHSTPKNEGLPVIPILAAIFKSTAGLQMAQTAGRIALTFVPVILLKNHKNRRHLHFADIHSIPGAEEKKLVLLQRIRTRTIFFQVLLAIPTLLFWLVIIASMERTPLTGRWRMIILSPEEEEDLASQLAGQGWYNAVGDILAQDGPPRYVPYNDWRYQWVLNTLRRLEATVPVLMKETDLCPEWLTSDRPMPPPAEYPLTPRPRASEYLRYICEKMCDRDAPPVAHSIPGPPYNLLLVERPDALNAFSYGFGPDGGGGIVVYSGFIDDIISRIPMDTSATPSPQQQSWWSYFLGGPPPPRQIVPNDEQTAELAILLAHELAHLLLSHHLETLSSATVIIPGTLSIFSDIIRVLIFPFTMLFGPFVNDAVAQLGKIGSGELVKIGEYCTSMKQEIEADVVSARLLAHAGLDAREAILFWEGRALSATECGHAEYLDDDTKISKSEHLIRRMSGSGHPVNEVRVDKLKSELVRWETERRAALARSRMSQEELQSNVNLVTA
jgi:Zn-dependent protease with chaperone function